MSYKHVLMVNHQGVRDWIILRVTSVIMSLYLLFIIAFLALNYPMQYQAWHSLFAYFWMKLITSIVLVSILSHGWIGVWTIFTDYVKPPMIRWFCHTAAFFLACGYLVWGLNIIWGY